jgi:hypothetical protein
VAYIKCQAELPSDESLYERVKPLLKTIFGLFGEKDTVQAKETAMATLSHLGQTIEDEAVLNSISSQLINQLAEPDIWLKAQAHSTVRVGFIVSFICAT